MTQNDKDQLAMIDAFLDLVDESDWHLTHDAVRKGVQSGKYSKQFEAAYAGLVDRKLAENEADEADEADD